MSVFASTSGHEQVVFCQDRASGLRAIIAIYSTALGPALGGTRFYPYATAEDALADVLDLSRAMAYKNALAGLDHGGGKAVIIGDPTRDKSEALLRAYGRFVQSLGGRYVTACDVGTYVADMDMIARECDHVTGRSPENGGAGDSSVLTALGVFQGMRAAAQVRWGSATLRGRRIGVVGVGKVGHRLVELLLDDGASVVVTDVDSDALARVCAIHPSIEVAADAETLAREELDVLSPCAMGHGITVAVAQQLHAAVVCGAANNQLADAATEEVLAARGILYCPDFLVNAGGVIQVADERHGYVEARARHKAEGIFDATLSVLEHARAEGITAGEAAETLAEARMADIARLRGIWLQRAPADVSERRRPL